MQHLRKMYIKNAYFPPVMSIQWQSPTMQKMDYSRPFYFLMMLMVIQHIKWNHCQIK